MKTKPKKPMCPRRMWADFDNRSPRSSRFQVYNCKSEGNVLELVQFPVLVLDASPEGRAWLARKIGAIKAPPTGNVTLGFSVADAVLAAIGMGKAKQ